VVADAAEGLDHPVVAGIRHEHRGGRIATGRVGVGAAIDAVVVEHHDADRQAVPADRLDFHAGEAEGAVALDAEDRLAGLDGCRDGEAHADAHDAPGADIQALARLVHVNDAPGEVEGVGALVDQDRVGPLLDDGAQRPERGVEVHGRGVAHELRRHLGDVRLTLGLERLDPIGRGLLPALAHAVEERLHAGGDVADDGRHDLDVRVHLAGLDVDLDELGRARLAPALALAVRQQPVQPGADQQHHVRVLQRRRAGRAGRERVGVGQEALGHAHRNVGDAARLHEGADRLVGLGVGGALAEHDQRPLGGFQDLERPGDRLGSGVLGRGRVDHLDQRLLAGLGVHHLGEQLGGQVEVDAARTARAGGADGAGDADADVGRVQHPEGRLAQGLGDGELVHLLVVALLQVDDLALGGARDQDHREAVGGGVGERRQAVEEARGRDGEADARLLGQEARDRRGIAGMLLVAEGDHPHPLGLGHAAEIGDRDARDAVDRLDAVELERVDDEVEAVGQLRLGVDFGVGVDDLGECGHHDVSRRIGVDRGGSRRRLAGGSPTLRPHPQVPASGGPRRSSRRPLRSPEASMKASVSRRHLRMRGRVGDPWRLCVG